MARDITAESLEDMLTLLHLRRRSGLLKVEHVESSRFEDGEIYFQNGEPIYARARNLFGQEALDLLLTWEHVYFSFSIHAPKPVITAPAVALLTPRKRVDDQDVRSLPLTRPQRLIYLLVDGRRTIADIARCMRKSPQEIGRLLSELQERGLISL